MILGPGALRALAVAVAVVDSFAVAEEHGKGPHEDHGKKHHAEKNRTHEKAAKKKTTTSTVITKTTTTRTTTTHTVTSTTTTTRAHVRGGAATVEAAEAWFKLWRGQYIYGSPCGVVPCLLPQIDDDLLPKDLRKLRPKMIISSGGVATGVVSEGIGYGIMLEGFAAARGDKKALKNGLALTKSWLGMVYGPKNSEHPLGGGAFSMDSNISADSALKLKEWPYGVSAIRGDAGLGPSGVATWKFPLDQCAGGCTGSATDGDEDAVLGMIYLAAELKYPDDFVDMVMRAVISFASADLGFPDLYRTLPGGERMFVPKGGSAWGGLLPPTGKYKTSQQPWCYGTSYFAPAHYRAFRDFASRNWRSSFDKYLPPYKDGTATSISDLTAVFDGAITAGYNILYRASCESGSISNWVGVKAPCDDDETLGCDGVPWAHTPYVGSDKGQCEASGTKWGQFGADASRMAWRVALDYILYREESSKVTMYDTTGHEDKSVEFSAQIHLNRISKQYKHHAVCDAGKGRSECFEKPGANPWKLAYAFEPKTHPPHLSCDNVPNGAWHWWSSFMSYPTFTAFVAPLEEITPEESTSWMDTFSAICDFSADENAPKGHICSTAYFDASQAVISTMIMAGGLDLPKDNQKLQNELQVKQSRAAGMDTHSGANRRRHIASNLVYGVAASLLGLAVVVALTLFASARRKRARATSVFSVQARAPGLYERLEVRAAGASRAPVVPEAESMKAREGEEGR